mmetsp:Transcript_22907/g.50312  ORF Transcript_22907/g.50312 Transcript_22907/m.50312 type:complete len:280 (+) Transcript_22907:3537-4376(+)
MGVACSSPRLLHRPPTRWQFLHGLPTPEQLQLHGRLRLQCQQPLSGSADVEAKRQLDEMWRAVYDCPPPPIPDPRWKMLGFQGCDPRTDIRGAQAFGLRCMSEVVRRHRHVLAPIALIEKEQPDYLFAAACLNCYAVVAVHLGLAPHLVPPVAQAKAQDSRGLSAFLRLCQIEGDVFAFQELLAVVVRKMHYEWQKLRCSEPGLTINKFGEVLAKVAVCLEFLLGCSTLTATEDFEQIMDIEATRALTLCNFAARIAARFSRCGRTVDLSGSRQSSELV